VPWWKHWNFSYHLIPLHSSPYCFHLPSTQSFWIFLPPALHLLTMRSTFHKLWTTCMSSPPHYLQLNQNGVTGVTTAQVDNLSSVYRQLFSSLFAALDAKLVSVHKDNTKLTTDLSCLCEENTVIPSLLVPFLVCVGPIPCLPPNFPVCIQPGIRSILITRLSLPLFSVGERLLCSMASGTLCPRSMTILVSGGVFLLCLS